MKALFDALAYVRIKLIAILVRFIQSRQPDGQIAAHPDRVLRVPSRDPGRSIKVHLYHTAAPSAPASSTKPGEEDDDDDDDEPEWTDLPAAASPANNSSSIPPASSSSTVPSPSPQAAAASTMATAASPSVLEHCPVLITMHGSGWMLPLHGQDEVYCRKLVAELLPHPFAVLDVQYRLAPEYPYPAAVHDVEDVVRYVLSNSSRVSPPGPKGNSAAALVGGDDGAGTLSFDADRIYIGGFSAGGNLAISVATDPDLRRKVLGGEAPDVSEANKNNSNSESKHVFRGLVTFYPVVDITIDPGSKKAPEGDNSKVIPDRVARALNEAYAFPGQDRRQRGMCPTFFDDDEGGDHHDGDDNSAEGRNGRASWPPQWLNVTCGWDNLALEAERLADRVRNNKKVEVVSERVGEVRHAWDKTAEAGSREERERDRTYGLAAAMMTKMKK